MSHRLVNTDLGETHLLYCDHLEKDHPQMLLVIPLWHDTGPKNMNACQFT